MGDVPVLGPSVPFEQACAAVLDFLDSEVPLAHWSVTRFDGEDQVVLAVNDQVYGKRPGARRAWADTLCAIAAAGDGPRVAPDAMAVPAYRQAPAAADLRIGAFVGVPILRNDGSVFGTLCGADPHPQPAALTGSEPLLRLLALLLATVLEADVARTETAERLAQAELASETDPLTGVFNRRGWDRYLQLEDDRCRRYGDPAAVIVIDLDNLKHVNDTRGHQAGDTLLCRTATALRHAARSTDVVARLGGDEFALLAPCTTSSQSLIVAARIHQTLTDNDVTASIGCASYQPHGGLHAASHLADLDMYQDKQRHKTTTPPGCST